MKSYFIFLSILALFFFQRSYSQNPNNDYKAGTINIPLPKTPESQAFEKYGNFQVSEFTGSPNISIPIYTVSGKFLNVPVSLTYNANGIRVSQEASWVGLGFDIVAGGRITVDTRGAIDNDGSSQSLFNSVTLKAGMEKIFHRLGDSGQLGILTYASACHNCAPGVGGDIPDEWSSVNAMAQFGLAEPDIFNANFLGNSLTFYFDKLTGAIKFIGEKSLIKIDFTKDAYDRIESWTLTDNIGTQYQFNQKETTTLSMPALGPLQNNTSTSAWLLTQITDVNGDNIVFTYTTYGSSYPSPQSWSASVTYKEKFDLATESFDGNQNSVIHQPAYLTRIESSHTRMDFVLDTRLDIKGPGSKRLKEIVITDKISGKSNRKISFSQDYFQGELLAYQSSWTSDEKGWSRLRLKLNSVSLYDSSAGLMPPYKFYYYLNGAIPNKYSYGIDHWGYFNGSAGGDYSYPNSPKNLLPKLGLDVTLGNAQMEGYASTRECNAAYLPIMTMDSIIYPTGGSTKIIYEPHQSSRVPSVSVIGGGLRVKTIRNYVHTSQIATTREYTYGAGIYTGTIQYHTVVYEMAPRMPDIGTPLSEYSQPVHTLSSTGTINDHNVLVGYPTVRVTEKSLGGVSNGSVLKRFKFTYPSYANNVGFELRPAHWLYGLNTGQSTDRLYASKAGFPPTPQYDLDGKLVEEQYFDQTDNLVKSVNYYYSKVDYSNSFYSIKVRDTRRGGGEAPYSGNYWEGEQEGNRRFVIFVSPAKSYFAHLDSVVERTFQGSNSIASKKSYQYNEYHQRRFESVFSSDGTQSIVYTKSSAEIKTVPYPIGPTGDAVLLNSMSSSAHILDLPIEQALLKRTLAGDTIVRSSRLNIYSGTLLKKVHVLETETPLVFRSQFIPMYFNYAGYPNYPTGGSFFIQMDEKYRQATVANYSTGNLITGMQSITGSTAYIWDEQYNVLLAQCINADPTDIAYTSFETAEKGRWNFNPIYAAANSSAPTGRKVYSLSSGAISANGLSPSKTYIVSYWTNAGAQYVNGSSAVTGFSVNGWTYFEHTVVNPSSGLITISGSAAIDELRLYPKTSQMTSYTHEPLTGMTSICDVNNRITYYEYDGFQRLVRIRDFRRNILKSICYNYSGSPENCMFYVNDDRSGYYVRNDCPAMYSGGSYYVSIPAGTTSSFLSVADANAKAEQYGQQQANINASCIPSCSFSIAGGISSPSKGISISGSSVSYYIVFYSTSSPLISGSSYQIATVNGGCKPSSPRVITQSTGGRNWEITFYPSGQVGVKILSGSNLSTGTTVSLSGGFNL